MRELLTLLDLARAKFPSDAALARALGVPPHHPFEWRHGKRAMSPETVTLLCDLLGMSGEEAREWLALAVIENPKNASRAAKLRQALFRVLGAWRRHPGSTDDKRRRSDARDELHQTTPRRHH
jgi:plasmid maintenance system antidote protein VapI